MNKVKKRIFEIIEVAKPNDKASKCFDLFIMILIFLNIVFAFVSTFEIPEFLYRYFDIFESFSVAVFTVEYILRIYTSDLLYSEISAGFMEDINSEKNTDEVIYCPHCGKKIKS